MGKGDIKTRRGKFFAGSFGKRRPRHKAKKPGRIVITADSPEETKSEIPGVQGAKQEEKAVTKKKTTAKNPDEKENEEKKPGTE